MTLGRMRHWGVRLAAAGAVGIGLGLLRTPDRTWAGLLIASFGLAAAGVGGVVFIALCTVSGATWPVAFRRIPEALAAALPAGALGLAAVFLLRPTLYPWLAGETLHGFKGAWLSPAFFFTRAAIYLGLWALFAWLIVRTSRAQDHDGSARHTARRIKLSAAFVVIFALSFWLASYDWIMSLEPHWYSTIFGVYNFAGLFSCVVAIVVLLAMGLRRAGLLQPALRDEHLHDLGKLLFAFSSFWMYIWFCQAMLIWYTNIPEESVYYVRRLEGSWATLFYLNVALNWVVPFVLLLTRQAKRTRMIAYAAGVVLLGRWLDLYLMIWPAAIAGAPHVGIGEIAPAVAAAGLLLLAFARSFASAPPVPLRDPALSASLHYHS
ncbi:MAG: hypothetical protein IT176_15110 [Acidobacteria bacterium]|nr:hypothetical protein [Acidobacteriota bacterium]